MEHFSEEHSKLLLSKEWLVKTNNQTSTPYLFKFYHSTVELSSCILLTDTKSVWAEVLTSNQFARRWRNCNPGTSTPFLDAGDEDGWRTTNLELLSRAHTLGGISDLSFEVVVSSYADLAFELEGETFKWKWETCYLGHKSSAEIISKHLIFPLVSVNHLLFSSTAALGEMPETDIEKAVDKIGRTARRTIDTHIKNALSKPRVSTTLRRMTAMFNFISDLPPIFSIAEKPDLQTEVQLPKVNVPPKSPIMRCSISPSLAPDTSLSARLAPQDGNGSLNPPLNAESATESEADEPVIMSNPTIRPPTQSLPPRPLEPQDRGTSRHGSQAPSTSRLSSSKAPASDSDSSPARPAKKIKKVDTSSDEDSEIERKRRVAQLKSGTVPAGVKRGTRQPIKRGGKRF